MYYIVTASNYAEQAVTEALREGQWSICKKVFGGSRNESGGECVEV